MDKSCTECGGNMTKLGDHKNTRLYMCSECFEEQDEFIANKCKHEYHDKNGNKCTQCGEPSIHYA